MVAHEAIVNTEACVASTRLQSVVVVGVLVDKGTSCMYVCRLALLSRDYSSPLEPPSIIGGREVPRWPAARNISLGISRSAGGQGGDELPFFLANNTGLVKSQGKPNR